MDVVNINPLTSGVWMELILRALTGGVWVELILHPLTSGVWVELILHPLTSGVWVDLITHTGWSGSSTLRTQANLRRPLCSVLLLLLQHCF